VSAAFHALKKKDFPPAIAIRQTENLNFYHFVKELQPILTAVAENQP
jgi:hypothetical protein